MNYRIVNITVILLICFSAVNMRGQDIRPQLWNNLATAWNINDEFVVRGGIVYNVLLSSEAPWSEFTVATSGIYHFHRFMEAGAGLYLASANQSEALRSNEYRPSISFRVFTNTNKRWYVTNLSRLEFRFFRYSDRTKDEALRFRNRTYAVFSLLKPTMVDDKNLFFYGYFEAFYNFGKEVRERFFNQFKYKLGFGYRLSYPWRFSIGVIYQDARDNIEGPSQLPVIVNTNWVLEWGVVFVIHPSTKKKKNTKD